MATSADDDDGNVYHDLPGTSSISIDDIDEPVLFDMPTGGAAAAFPTPPPPLLPKKGNSFRQSYAILDRQSSSISPKPVPRLRKQSLDPLSDGEPISPLDATSSKRISRSCELSPPNLDRSLQGSSVNFPRGSVSSLLGSSMSFNEGDIPSVEKIKMPVSKVNSLGSVCARPVPVPRARTVFKKKEPESTETITEGKEQSLSKNFQSQSDATPDPFKETELNQFMKSQNDEIDNLFKGSEQVTNSYSVFKTSAKSDDFNGSISVQSDAHNKNENGAHDDDEDNVYENIETQGNLPAVTKNPSLPATPKVPPRPKRAQSSSQSPATVNAEKDEPSSETSQFEVSWNKTTTDEKASASKNSDTDFFNFDAFNISSSSAASNDPWPGVQNVSSSSANNKPINDSTVDFDTPQPFQEQSQQPTTIPDFDGFPASQPFDSQSEKSTISSFDTFSTHQTFDDESKMSSIPSIDDTFSATPPTANQTTPDSNSAPFIDLGDFDPLSTDINTNATQALSDAYSTVNKDKTETKPLMSLDTKIPIQDTLQSPEDSLTPNSPGIYVDLDSTTTASSDFETNKAGDIYSFASEFSQPQPKVPPKPPAKPLTHAPSFHFNPPTAPPPPLPRTENRGVSESAPPPVPPRPNTIGNISRPIAPPRNSHILEDLPTPVFSPMADNTDTDPFKDSTFGDECYNFNKTLNQHDNEQQSGFAQASAFSSTPSPVAAASAGFERNNVAAAIPSREPMEAGASAMPDSRQDPDRISQFVIPVPGSSGSSTPGNNLLHSSLQAAGGGGGSGGIYSLAEELSSSDSEYGDGPSAMTSERPRWTSGGQPVAGLTIMDSGQLAPRKNQRYGYLYKQGGYNANKGWKKRWVVFNGTSLSYYDNNTSQVSKRIIPVSCMKEVLSDVKTNERHSFKFKVVTTLQDRVFIFSAESLEDCVLWSNNIMAGITEYKKAKLDPKSQQGEEKSDKEGFIKFNNMKKYYVVISGHHLRYFRSFKDFQMGSPIHEVDMKLASVKVKDRRRCRLQLWLNYDHFDLNFDNDSDMQSWRMAMEDAIAEGLADDTVLEKVSHNISNRECADCGAEKPHWASINLGIVVCKNCAGIHRMFDYHVSKIRSLRMDTRVWTPSLIELMVTVGNANANAFWEYSLSHDLKLNPSCTIEERKDFIHKKYFNKKFRNHHPLTGMAQALGEELHRVASSDNVLEAMKILFSGAEVLFKRDGCDETAYDIAKAAGQRLIMELLYQNGGDAQAVIEDEEDETRLREDIRLQGYLNKTGPAGRTYDKRWCVLEHGALNYYINEKSLTSKGSIDRRNMLLIQEITLDRPGFHFEISTNSREHRVYSFSVDSRDEAGEWMRTIAKLIAPVAVMEHVGMIDTKFAGYAHLRESVGTEWKQSFLAFTHRGLYYMNKDLKFDYIDLRKASSIKLQNSDSGCHLVEKGPCFIICSTGKSLYLQAPLPRDTEKMFNALLFAVKGSGCSLMDQALTNENVPVIVDKCITHIAKLGLEEKGIYRLGAQSSRIQALLDEFRKDAGAVVLESYTVNEVANVVKRFLRELEDSVFERINYPQWTSMAASKDVNNRLMWYKYYLEKMPPVNYSTLKRLILHLTQVASYEASNQMNMFNLATCFAPSLLRTEMDVPNLMSDVSSREINIIVDLISYQDYFFEDKENERKINDQIRKAEQRIMQEMQATREGTMASSANIEKILTPVHMINASGPAVNILVTDDTKAQHALDYFKRSKATSDIDTSSFALYELVSKGVLVRPLFPEESMSPTVKRWLEWEDWVKEDNSVSLCARNTELLEKLDANYNATHILMSKLQYCDSKGKKFKRYTVGFRQCRLEVYTNPKAVVIVASWNVEDLTFYIGAMPKKSTPTKYCLTFIVKGEKCSKSVGMFGHCLCFDTEDELYRWAAALYIAQHPGGFLTWNS